MAKHSGDMASGGLAGIAGDPARVEAGFRESLGVDGLADTDPASTELIATSAVPTYGSSDAEARDGSGGGFTLDVTGQGDAFATEDEALRFTAEAHGDRLTGPEDTWAVVDAQASDLPTAS